MRLRILLLAGLVAGLAMACAPKTSGGDADSDVDSDGDGDADSDSDDDGDSVVTCTSTEECDDEIECTTDLCAVGGVCRNEPVHSRCPDEQRCVPGRGCLDIECEVSADCDDHVFCNGVEQCLGSQCYDAADPRSCDDGYDCTEDYCSTATDQCVHDPISGCTGDGGTDGGPEPFDPEVHYSGTFRVFGLPSSDCGAASYDIRQVTLSSSADELLVQAGSFPMRQAPRPTGESFDVTHTQGSCGVYRLWGSFIDSNDFSAHWTATFSGGCNTCDDQDAEVYGVRNP